MVLSFSHWASPRKQTDSQNQVPGRCRSSIPEGIVKWVIAAAARWDSIVSKTQKEEPSAACTTFEAKSSGQTRSTSKSVVVVVVFNLTLYSGDQFSELHDTNFAVVAMVASANREKVRRSSSIGSICGNYKHSDCLVLMPGQLVLNCVPLCSGLSWRSRRRRRKEC